MGFFDADLPPLPGAAGGQPPFPVPPWPDSGWSMAFGIPPYLGPPGEPPDDPPGANPDSDEPDGSNGPRDGVG